MPFVTAGDPDLEFTAAVLAGIRRAVAAACAKWEFPTAIRLPMDRSFRRRTRVRWRTKSSCRKSSKSLGKRVPKLQQPIVTMVSYAIVYRHGLEKYVDDAQRAGIAGAIVPDLLVEESEPLAKICRARRFQFDSTCHAHHAARACQCASPKRRPAFIYYVSVTGITGERRELPPELIDNVGWLREQTPLPICIGFGISTPEHVRLLAPVADGLIVGSAVVRRIAEAAKPSRAQEVLADVGEYVIAAGGVALAGVQRTPNLAS